MKKPLILCHPRCTTCKKAKTWLDENGIAYDERSIIEENPTVDELREWHAKSGLPLKRFFNTSGTKYKELSLKDKLPNMTEDEQYSLLARDGMLVKRPLLVTDTLAVPGFKEKEWQDAIEGKAPSDDAAPKAKAKQSVKASYPALVMKITLRGMKPPVWRRLIVPINMTFHNLNDALIIAMGWDGTHLSNFHLPEQQIDIIASLYDYTDIDFDECLRADRVRLSKYLAHEKKFIYTYDMGDNWEHTVTIEKRIEDYEHNYPIVTAYKGNCPPDDSGGVWGYMDLLEREDEDAKTWLEEYGDREYDLEHTNYILEGIKVRSVKK